MSLEELRGKIDSLDNEIVRLIAKRLSLAWQIGHEKRQKQSPVMDAKRERHVLDRVRKLAAEKGANEAAIGNIYREIILASRNAQHAQTEINRGSKRKALHKVKIAVIGASGKMGQWFIDFLLSEGFSVCAAHSNKSRLQKLSFGTGIKVCTNIEAVRKSDVIILSVPAAKFEHVLNEIAPHTRAGQVIIDVSSVRTGPLKITGKYIKKAMVLGVHPMFGPGAKGIAGQGFVITPVAEKEKALALKVKSFLEERGADVSIMAPAEHDRQMAIILALAHFTAHVTADTIVSSGISEKDRASFGTTFKVLLTFAAAVLSENPEFYAGLQVDLPDAVKVEKLFRTKVALWAGPVKKGRKDRYAANLAELKKKFDELFPGYKDSYKKMNRVVGE